MSLKIAGIFQGSCTLILSFTSLRGIIDDCSLSPRNWIVEFWGIVIRKKQNSGLKWKENQLWDSLGKKVWSSLIERDWYTQLVFQVTDHPETFDYIFTSGSKKKVRLRSNFLMKFILLWKKKSPLQKMKQKTKILAISWKKNHRIIKKKQ